MLVRDPEDTVHERVYIRRSMKKFESSHTKIEVLNHTKCKYLVIAPFL